MSLWSDTLGCLGPVAYLAPDLARTPGFGALVPSFMAVVADAQGAAERVGFPTIQVGAAEEGQRASAGWLDVPEVQQALREFGAQHVLFFKATHQARQLATSLGLQVLAGVPDVAQRFEHKVQISQIAARHGWPTPPTLTFSQGLPNARELPWPAPWVVQGARGHSGQSTHLVMQGSQYDALRRSLAGRAARISPKLEGPTVTANGVAMSPEQVVVGEPYLQITGLAGCTPHPLGACGNIWHAGAFADPALRKLVRQVGSALAHEGYLGAFGVDMLLTDSGPLFVEVNPRVVSGLSLEALVYGPQAPSPAGLHLLATSGAPGHKALFPQDLFLAPGQQASQLVFYTLSTGPLRHSLRSGQYTLAARGQSSMLEYVSSEMHWAGCASTQGVLWVRSPGMLLKAGSEWARLQLPQAHLDTSGGSAAPSNMLAQWANAVLQGTHG